MPKPTEDQLYGMYLKWQNAGDEPVRLACALNALWSAAWEAERRRPDANDSRPRRLSEVQNDLYAEHLMIEQAVATGRMTPEDRERYWRKKGSV